MPVSINGNTGVITGLAVGGLPDGTVQLADLATTGTASSSTFLRGDGAFAEAGGGKVIQIQSANFSSQHAVNTTSFSASNITVNITPTSASSKIWVHASCNAWKNHSNTELLVTIYRDSTNLGNNYGFGQWQMANTGSGATFFAAAYNDSPNTTSQITYTVYATAQSGYSGMLGVNNVPTNITAIEYST